MFFHRSNFKKYLSSDQANLMAKVANKIIDDQGIVLYGKHFADGSCKDFSSEKTPTCTHVGIVIGLSEMGSFEPNKEELSIDLPSREDEIRALEEKAKRLEAENRQLRNK